LGATIPEKINTAPTKMAPTRKKRINHSLFIIIVLGVKIAQKYDNN
jgi:hypothetical protein